MYFRDIAWETIALTELEQRRHENELTQAAADVPTARRVADLSFTYPNLDGGVVTAMGLAQIDPLTPEADQMANYIAQYENRVKPDTTDHSIFDRGYSVLKAGVRSLFTFGSSVYDEVIKGGSSFAVGLSQGLGVGEAARRSFGFSSGATAIASALQGRPVNLGSGFMPGGDFAPETIERLRSGMPLLEAIRNPAQLEIGLPAFDYGEARREAQGVRVGQTATNPGVPVTPGRAIASTITEPGTQPFHYMSGALDFASNIFADPAAGLGKAAGLTRASNAQIVANGARPGVLARGVDEWLQSGHGIRVADWIAHNDDFLDIHNILRNSQKGKPQASFVRALQRSTDPDQVRTLLRAGAETGHIDHVVGRQGLAARGLENLAEVFGADPQRVATVQGWRSLVTDRVHWNWWDRMAAETGARGISVADSVDQAVIDLGEWMKIAQFDRSRISHWMGEMADLQVGESERAFGVVLGVVNEFGDELKKAGISAPVADEIVRAFSSADDLKKYWINQAGNPELFVGGKFKINIGGEVVAVPSAHLTSEFLSRVVPLPDIRKVRNALNKRRWAQAIGTLDEGLKTSYLNRLDDFDKFGPGTIEALMDGYMQKAWKPLTLLRLAWPVRVVGEEQIRMLGAGLDSGLNHPFSWISMAIQRGKGIADETPDIAGNPLMQAKLSREAMSHGGDNLLHRRSAPYDISEWTKVEKGSPRFLEGWAIQLNHLSDDDLAVALAREIVDDPDGDVLGAVARVKQRFLNGDLEDHRLRLSRDGRSWQMFSQDWAAESYVDSVLARMQQATGGRYRAHDWIRGEWRDDLGNIIPADQAPPPIPRRRELIGYATGDSSPQLNQFLEQTRTFGDATLFTRLDEIDGGDIDAANEFLAEIDGILESYFQVTGKHMEEVAGAHGADDIMELIEDSVDGLLQGNTADRSVLEATLGGMQREITNARNRATEVLTPTGRAEMSARDLIEATDQQGALDIYGGLQTNDVIDADQFRADLLERPRLQKGELGEALEGQDTALPSFDVHDIQPGEPRDGVFSYPARPAYSHEEAGFTYMDTYVTHNGKRTGVLISKLDPDGRLVDVTQFRVGMKDTGVPMFRDDAEQLLLRALGDRGLTGDELYDLTFGGVSMREWLESADVIDGSQLSIREMLDIVREQYGKSWSRRGTGSVADLPSVAVTADGQRAVDSVMRTARRRARRYEEYQQLDPYHWSQDRMMYEITEWGNNDLLRAIADGEWNGKALRTSKLSDLASRKQSGIREIARELESMQDFAPQFTAVARKKDPSAFAGLDKATDALFHYLGSVPTNTLSRSPAFKQFYWRRVAELYPLMDEAAQADALARANQAGISSIGDALKATFKGNSPTELAFNRRARDFVTNRFDGVSGKIGLDEADEVAKAFALQETKALLYDVSKRSNFFDITRNIFPFGEAWLEIITTWARLVNENPALLFRGQQAIEGARQAGIFYPDPSSGQELFAFPFEGVTDWMIGGMESDQQLEASPRFVGRVSGLNIAGSLVPGVGPMVQLGVAKAFGDVINHPDLRNLRDLVFPFGQPDEEQGLGDVLLPSWFRKALTAIGRPTGDDERLFANTVTDVLRAMQVNGEIDLSSPDGWEEAQEVATSRAQRIYMLRTISAFVGPTPASVQWDVENDETGLSWTYQVLSTAYFEELDAANGDHDVAMDQFIKIFGLDPFDPMDRAYGRESIAGIVRGKSRQIVARSVTEEGLDYEATEPELFKDFPLTAYFTEPDDPDGEFNYNAYLNQLREQTRVALSPEEWRRERNILLGRLAYDKARRGVIAAGTENDPAVVAWLRNLRFQLMEKYDGYGYDSLGTEPRSGDEIRAEFEDWLEDPRTMQTDAGRGLAIYLEARERAVRIAELEFNVTENGFATANATQYLRDYLFQLAQSIVMQHPDFGVIFERYYAREVDNPLLQLPTQVAGVSLTNDSEDI